MPKNYWNIITGSFKAPPRGRLDVWLWQLYESKILEVGGGRKIVKYMKLSSWIPKINMWRHLRLTNQKSFVKNLPFKGLSLVTLIPVKIFDWMSWTGSEENVRLENEKIGGKFFDIGNDLRQISPINLNGGCSKNLHRTRFKSVRN